MCVRWYASTSMQRQALVTSWVRVAEKSVKGALNLQDLLYLIIFIYIIYLQMILLWFRPLGLKYIYLLWEHHTKSIAERSYSLLRGRVFTIQISLPGAIPLFSYCSLPLRCKLRLCPGLGCRSGIGKLVCKMGFASSTFRPGPRLAYWGWCINRPHAGRCTIPEA